MLRWTLILRKLFAPFLRRKLEARPLHGSLRVRPTARRPRASAKPSLEVLTERVMPSMTPAVPLVASPPVVVQGSPPAVAPSGAADQLTHLVAVLQDDLSSVRQAISQEVAQLTTFVLQRWEHLIDTVLHVAGTATDTASPQTLAPTTPTVPPAMPTQVAAPAGGTLGTPITHAPSHHSGVQPALGMGNVYTWSPTDPNRNAGDAWNWLKNGNVQKQGTPGITTPTAGDQVVFDGNVSAAPINWNTSMQVGSMLFINGTYTGTQSIAKGATVELTGTNFPGGALIMTQTASNLNLNFLDSTSTFQIDDGATITNMNLTGVSSASFVINGGTTMIAQSSAYTDNIGVNFIIMSAATLDDQSYTPLTFTQNNMLTLTVLGKMVVFYGTGNGKPLIDRNGSVGDYILVTNGGLLTYSGWQGITDTFRVPIRVQDGDFNVSLNANSPLGQGKLVVQGAIAQTNTVSVYLTGHGTSTVTLGGWMSLECDNDYYQDNGDLYVEGSTLQAGAAGGGTVTIAGGTLTLSGTPSGTYSVLTVDASDLNLNGQLILWIQGNNPFVNGELDVTGTTNLQAVSSLYVNINNQLAPMKTWTIIKDGPQNGISGNFIQPITTNPPSNLTGEVNPTDQTKYILNS